MQWDIRRGHIEYVSKVLGASTVLRSERQPQPVPLLRVVVEISDLEENQVLFQKILAAWNLNIESIKIDRVHAISEVTASRDEGTCQLVFADSPEGAETNLIFASSLKALSQSPSLKKKLWEQIQRARPLLNGVMVPS